MKLAARLLFVTVAWVIFAPGVASAQSAIAGIVKDTTGSIMPGVTVEAASPALIERVRSAITDAQGQYKIVDLRPGTYSVTFTLPGFATVKRDRIELPQPKLRYQWGQWTSCIVGLEVLTQVLTQA